MGKRVYWTVVSLAAGLAICAQSRTIYVDADGSADFSTIQAAIDDANDGDTVIVAEGVYFENVEFRGRNIVLSSANPVDERVVAETIIDGGGLDSAVSFDGTENATCVLTGFTIRNGYCDGDTSKGGGGICGGTEVDFTEATIRGNRIIGNHAWDGGAMSRCEGLIEGNFIASNESRWWLGGGGLYQCNGVIRTNIIVGNMSWGCDGGAAISTCDALIENCTIAYNKGYGLAVIEYGDVTLRNCIIWGNYPEQIGQEASFSCTDIDPVFADPGYTDINGTPDDYGDDFYVPGDYHLKSQGGRYDAAAGVWVYDDVTSPCIDRGDPGSPVGLETFANGGVINMGAYGGTSEASRSYFGKAPCETIVAGDINGDCRVDMLDFCIMVCHWCEDHNR